MTMLVLLIASTIPTTTKATASSALTDDASFFEEEDFFQAPLQRHSQVLAQDDVKANKKQKKENTLSELATTKWFSEMFRAQPHEAHDKQIRSDKEENQKQRESPVVGL